MGNLQVFHILLLLQEVVMSKLTKVQGSRSDDEKRPRVTGFGQLSEGAQLLPWYASEQFHAKGSTHHRYACQARGTTTKAYGNQLN